MILCSAILSLSSFVSAMMQARRNLLSVAKRGRFFSASIDPTKTEVTLSKAPKVCRAGLLSERCRRHSYVLRYFSSYREINPRKIVEVDDPLPPLFMSCQ